MDMGGRLKPSYKRLEPLLSHFEPGTVVSMSTAWFTLSTVVLCVYVQHFLDLQYINWVDISVLTAIGADLLTCKYPRKC